MREKIKLYLITEVESYVYLQGNEIRNVVRRNVPTILRTLSYELWPVPLWYDHWRHAA